MRFLRRFQGQPTLPPRCFISHSYSDARARADLLSELPREVEPFIFPEIKAAPDQMVSNELIKAILECGGLIYLKGGYSERSFWVAFERDYALRAGKIVFSYDPQTRVLARDSSPPLNLSIFANYARADEYQVGPILSQMRTERSFDLPSLDDVVASGTDVLQTLNGNIMGVLDRGGYVVMFWSKRAAESRWVQEEYSTVIRLDPGHYASHIFFARLDEAPLPIPLVTFQRSDRNEVRFFDTSSGSYLHHIDDLIVRLYWRIYQKTRQNQLE